jgi:hypothetical protein
MPVILFPITDSAFTPAENQFVQYLRQVLKDTDDVCQIFDDSQLLSYIDLALMDINSHPTVTFYTVDTVPRDWYNVIILGAYVFALNAQGLTERARNFNISDQGINYTPPDLPGHMVNLAQAMETKFQTEKERIKANVRPMPQGLGSTRVLTPNPLMMRLRHLRAHRFF